MLEERPHPALRRDLEIVRREAARAGQIVRNLLSFVRRGAPDRVAADLNDIIRATVELRIYHLQQCNITIETVLHDGPIPVLVNREEIQQVVLNLVLNAEQAMAASGRGSRITVRSVSSERHRYVEVADDGPGIGVELRGRIFEPFFTTKEVGEGTGLGLSISHGIASAHGGSLELCPGAGGACFRLTLPAPTDLPRSGPAAAAKRDAIRRALVVDDEAPIRKLLVRLLERRGFEAIEAETGAAALAVAGGTPLSVVLCDIRMPGMNGIELYRQMSAKNPEIGRSFVFITGDNSSMEMDDSIRDVPVLIKPFTAADLEAVLMRVGVDAALA
jgi:two-component system NtrC family sensor kinase